MRRPERHAAAGEPSLRAALALLLALPTPFVLVLAAVWLAHATPPWPSPVGLAILASYWAAGCGGVALAPLSIRLRWVVGVIWAVLLGPALLLFALAADCGLYGLCL